MCEKSLKCLKQYSRRKIVRDLHISTSVFSFTVIVVVQWSLIPHIALHEELSFINS